MCQLHLQSWFIRRKIRILSDVNVNGNVFVSFFKNRVHRYHPTAPDTPPLPFLQSSPGAFGRSGDQVADKLHPGRLIVVMATLLGWNSVRASDIKTGEELVDALRCSCAVFPMVMPHK